MAKKNSTPINDRSELVGLGARVCDAAMAAGHLAAQVEPVELRVLVEMLGRELETVGERIVEAAGG